jgi:hypothetical protein
MNRKMKKLMRLGAVLIASALGVAQYAVAQFDSDALNQGPSDRFSSQQLEAGIGITVPTNAARSSSPHGQLIVPANTTAGLELRSIVNSRTAHAGQMIYCTTTYPIAAADRAVIPAGTFVRGRITRVVVPKRFKGRAEIAMRFDQIVLPNGTIRPIDAELVGISGTGPEAYSEHDEAIVGQGSKSKDLAGVLKSAAEWSTVGSLSAVNSGDSALVGGVLGAAGGVVKFADVFLSRADAIVLVPGTNLEISFVAPLIYPAGEVQSGISEASLVAHLGQEMRRHQRIHSVNAIPSEL